MTKLERNEIARFLNGLAAAAYERQHGRPNMVTILKSDTDHAINLLHEEYFRLTAFERKIKKAAKKARAVNSPDVLRLDLGPDFYNSLPLANGYQWTARGRIYPAGTMAARPPCVVDIEAPAIGNYLIRGLTGNQSEHLAVYAVRLNVGTPDLKQYIFSGLIQTGLDAEGFPRLFFDAASLLGEPGRVVFVEYLPRSADCFGGQLKIYTQKGN